MKLPFLQQAHDDDTNNNDNNNLTLLTSISLNLQSKQPSHDPHHFDNIMVFVDEISPLYL